MQSNAPGKPTILVTDAGRGSAIAIIRSLGRRGWRVIAADCDRHSPGFRSRYTADALVYPLPQTSPRETVMTLLAAAGYHGVDLIIPVTDELILPLSRERSMFENVCRLALPEEDALEVTTNKLETLALARRLQVPVPRTRLVHTVDEALRGGPALGWPVVLKPQVSRRYGDGRLIEAFAVCYAQDRDDLARQMRPFEGRCPILMQEYSPGTGFGVELLLHEGRPLAAFQHRRLREVPINGGASSLRQSVPLEPELYGHAVRLLAELRWTGLAMVEFKVGPRGAMLMEVNGRVWGSLPLAVFSGMDFPARLAQMWLFGPPRGKSTPETSYKIGVRARNLELDLVWIASVLIGRRRYPFLHAPGRLRALAALAGLLSPRCKFDIISLEDPRPGAAELLKIVRKFATKWKRPRQHTPGFCGPRTGALETGESLETR